MKTNPFFIFCLVLVLLCSCKRSDYLNAKPDSKLVVPQNLSDYQAILDNDINMNGTWRSGGLTPSFADAGSDDYYAIQSITSQPVVYKNLYTWNDDIYAGNNFSDWSFGYRTIFYANTVLDGIARVSYTPAQMDLYKTLKGSALFYRAYLFHQLAQVFSQPYQAATATTDLGLPLRLSSDINEPIERSSVKDTYAQIVSDIKESIPLLPSLSLYKTRPSKIAAYALLARVYLSIGEYDNALLFADSVLQTQPSLLDYNLVNSNNQFPFQRFNDEVIFQAVTARNLLTMAGIARVDTTLLNTYDSTDLRRNLFYQSSPTGYFFRGSYDNSNYLFSGLATDEVYLIRAECYARKGNENAALADLNSLMIKRRKNTIPYIPITASNAPEALIKVLNERRKELVFRSIRWSDLRRLNKEGANITVIRVLNGQTYTLAPNSLHYTFPIPTDVLSFNPGMQQNPR